MAQEVGVRNIQELKQFGSDLKRLSEQLSNAFHSAEKKMNRVCDGWNDTSNQKFMTAFEKDALSRISEFKNEGKRKKMSNIIKRKLKRSNE